MDVSCTLYQHWDKTVAPTPDNVLVVVLELPVVFLPGNFFQQLIENMCEKILPLFSVHGVVASLPDLNRFLDPSLACDLSTSSTDYVVIFL